MWIKLRAKYSAALRSRSISPLMFCIQQTFCCFGKIIARDDNIPFVHRVDQFSEAFITHCVYWTLIFDSDWMQFCWWFQCVVVSLYRMCCTGSPVWRSELTLDDTLQQQLFLWPLCIYYTVFCSLFPGSLLCSTDRTKFCNNIFSEVYLNIFWEYLLTSNNNCHFLLLSLSDFISKPE